jgi:hypothetical protein
MPLLIDFVGDQGAQLFPPDVASKDYLATFSKQLQHAATLGDKLMAHLLSDPDYQAYMHPNLNIDNAYWWRDENGVLDAGLIDWSGYSCKEVRSHSAYLNPNSLQAAARTSIPSLISSRLISPHAISSYRSVRTSTCASSRESGTCSSDACPRYFRCARPSSGFTTQPLHNARP